MIMLKITGFACLLFVPGLLLLSYLFTAIWLWIKYGFKGMISEIKNCVKEWLAEKKKGFSDFITFMKEN